LLRNFPRGAAGPTVQGRVTSGDMVRLGPDFRMRFSLADESEASVRRQTYEASVRDPLTGLFNRRYLLQRMGSEIQHAERMGSDIALLMMDVDGLKRVNDQLGHLAGDRALCALARAVLDGIRLGDLAARYGGDEFAVLAPGTTRPEAAILAERITRTAARLHFSAGGSPVPISSCIGIASLTELGAQEAAAVDLLMLADARLYEAKRARPDRAGPRQGRSKPPPHARTTIPETTEVRTLPISPRAQGASR
jgi:diguanylate cyclase (GGDEF)-like protein